MRRKLRPFSGVGGMGAGSHESAWFLSEMRMRFVDSGSTDSEKVYTFRNCDSRASFPPFPLRSLLEILVLNPTNGGSSGPTVIHALRRWLIAFSRYTSTH